MWEAKNAKIPTKDIFTLRHVPIFYEEYAFSPDIVIENQQRRSDEAQKGTFARVTSAPVTHVFNGPSPSRPQAPKSSLQLSKGTKSPAKKVKSSLRDRLDTSVQTVVRWLR